LLKKKIWHDWDEQAEQERQKKLQEERDQERDQDRDQERATKKEKEYMNVTVTEVLDGGWFYVQIKSDELDHLEGLMEQLQRVEKKQPPGYSPKTNDYCLAKFVEDNQYYRALIRGFTEKKEYRVFYIDYGNTELVPLSFLAPIEESFLKFPHQVK